MKIEKHNPHHWWLLLQQGVYTVTAIFARYLSPRPKKPVVVLYGHQLSGNLKALYEEWRASRREDFDCYFLSLDPQYSQTLRAQGAPVLQCSRLRDMLLVGRCDAMITDHGLHAMSPFISFSSIIFVDVWHGIPFKGFTGDDFRVQHRYDEVWVSSPLLKRIYQEKFGFSPDIVHDLGYARADKLFLNQAPGDLFREKIPIRAGDKVVLYAPTWQHDNTGRELFPFNESQDSFIQRLNDICQKYSAKLLIRNHLNTRISAKTFENVRYCSMKDFPDTEALLQHTDILICDWSSISFDYLALNRPTVFLDVPPPFKNGFSLGEEYRFGKVAKDMASLITILENTLNDPSAYTKDQATSHAAITRAVYGDNTDGTAASRQLDRLVGLMRR